MRIILAFGTASIITLYTSQGVNIIAHRLVNAAVPAPRVEFEGYGTHLSLPILGVTVLERMGSGRTWVIEVHRCWTRAGRFRKVRPLPGASALLSLSAFGCCVNKPCAQRSHCEFG